MINTKKISLGFTLIELLVTISIIGVLVTISSFALSGARESSRDARRKTDLELIRSGLEQYRADCSVYPASLPAAGSQLIGTAPSGSCSTANVYISAVPTDPQSGRVYIYARTANTSYQLCAGLEGGGTSTSCGASSACQTGVNGSCNYRVTSQ